METWACSGSAVHCMQPVRESAMKSVGKPDAGNRHVRFDERGWETGQRMSVPAPILDSTPPPGFRPAWPRFGATPIETIPAIEKNTWAELRPRFASDWTVSLTGN